MNTFVTSSANKGERWNIGNRLEDQRRRKFVIVMKKCDLTCHLDEEFRLFPEDGKQCFLPQWMTKREMLDEGFMNMTSHSPLTRE